MRAEINKIVVYFTPTESLALQAVAGMLSMLGSHNTHHRHYGTIVVFLENTEQQEDPPNHGFCKEELRAAYCGLKALIQVTKKDMEHWDGLEANDYPPNGLVTDPGAHINMMRQIRCRQLRAAQTAFNIVDQAITLVRVAEEDAEEIAWSK